MIDAVRMSTVGDGLTEPHNNLLPHREKMQTIPLGSTKITDHLDAISIQMDG